MSLVFERVYLSHADDLKRFIAGMISERNRETNLETSNISMSCKVPRRIQKVSFRIGQLGDSAITKFRHSAIALWRGSAPKSC